MKKLFIGLSSFTGMLFLTGCSSLSGYQNAQTNFSCNAPKGVSCTSVSGTYANEITNNLPSQRVNEGKKQKKDDSDLDEDLLGVTPDDNKRKRKALYKSEWDRKVISWNAPKIETPIYNKPHVMRIWIAPWEDKEHVLHDQSYVYIVVQRGEWNLPHIKQTLKKDARISVIKK